MENDNTQGKENFDRLVSSISDSERKTLLEKMHSLAGDPSSQVIEEDAEKDIKNEVSVDDKFLSESFFYRFILWIRSIFRSSSVKDIYNEDLVLSLFKKINRSYPGLIDYKNGYLLSIFYEKVVELKRVADFFTPYVNAINEDISAFYVFLGSILMPEVTEEMNRNANPLNLPLTKDVTGELRTSMLRKQAEILKDISSQKHNYMYTCVLGIEWLRQFVKLPFDRLINSFSLISSSYVCRFENVSGELNSFARIMCNGQNIREETLEALFLFSSNKIVVSSSEAKDDEGRAKEFMDISVSNLSIIHMFVTTVQMRLINRIVYNNIEWQPDAFGGAEDWYVKYKDQWKKLFDSQWNKWLRDKKKDALNQKLKTAFDISSFPLLNYRPWAQMWEGIPFHFEQTAGFLCWFMQNKYLDEASPLKILSFEGAFINKENRVEFANTLNDFAQIYNEVYKLLENLSPKGQFGLVFDKLAQGHLRTLQAQSKIDSIMLTVEGIVQDLKARFCADCRVVNLIVNGILKKENKDSRYDSIQNIMSIQGAQNAQFKINLEHCGNIFLAALDMLRELESLDLPGGLATNM